MGLLFMGTNFELCLMIMTHKKYAVLLCGISNVDLIVVAYILTLNLELTFISG